jgi:hypothetical protein
LGETTHAAVQPVVQDSPEARSLPPAYHRTMSTAFDAIVVGARCAGSPTAMLLARKGHRVLLVDRATFPSDTVSTHILHPLGVRALSAWGLLDV